MKTTPKPPYRRMKSTRPRPRNGFTLAEMVGVLILTTTIIGMVATLTGKALSKYTHTIDRAMAVRMDSYWMERFRSDVHFATDSTIDPTGQSLQLAGEQNETIEYYSTDTQLIRRRSLGGQIRSEETLRTPLRFRFQRKPMANCDLMIASSESSDPIDSCEIHARLGCQRRQIR